MKHCVETIGIMKTPLEGPIIGRDSGDPFLNPVGSWIENNDCSEPRPGCPVGCIYCNQMAFEVGQDGKKESPYISPVVDAGISLNTRLMSLNDILVEIEPEVLVRELMKYPGYFPEVSLMIENFNDPGFNWRKTIRLLELLLENGHVGPMVFLTKFGIGEKYAQELKTLMDRGAKIIAGVTYSALPREIENVPESRRINSMKRFSEAGIPVILSIRPIISGINDDDETFIKILSEAGIYATIITAGGLFVYDNFTWDAFENAGYPLDKKYDNGYPLAKIIDSKSKERIEQLLKDMELDILFANHFSCAVATVMTLKYKTNTSDKMARWANPFGNVFDDCGNCIPEQKKVCVRKSNESFDKIVQLVQEAVSALGYQSLEIVNSNNIPGLILILNGLLSLEELFIIESRCGWDVNNLPDEVSFERGCVNVFREDLDLNYFDVVRKIELKDQEWFVYINKDISEEQKKIIENFLRGRIRCRIFVNYI